MSKFVVEVENQGSKFWLGGTVWRFAIERATLHDSEEEAKAALEKARRFMTATIYRRARVVPA